MRTAMNDEIEVSSFVRSQQVDGEMFLLNFETGIFFGLNEIGVVVWEHLQEHGNVNNLSERLSAQYDMDQSCIDQDIESLLTDLKKHGLVVTTTEQN